jgi:hypothetical protein
VPPTPTKSEPTDALTPQQRQKQHTEAQYGTSQEQQQWQEQANDTANWSASVAAAVPEPPMNDGYESWGSYTPPNAGAGSGYGVDQQMSNSDWIKQQQQQQGQMDVPQLSSAIPTQQQQQQQQQQHPHPQQQMYGAGADGSWGGQLDPNAHAHAQMLAHHGGFAPPPGYSDGYFHTMDPNQYGVSDGMYGSHFSLLDAAAAAEVDMVAHAAAQAPAAPPPETDSLDVFPSLMPSKSPGGANTGSVPSSTATARASGSAPTTAAAAAATVPAVPASAPVRHDANPTPQTARSLARSLGQARDSFDPTDGRRERQQPPLPTASSSSHSRSINRISRNPPAFISPAETVAFEEETAYTALFAAADHLADRETATEKAFAKKIAAAEKAAAMKAVVAEKKARCSFANRVGVVRACNAGRPHAFWLEASTHVLK